MTGNGRPPRNADALAYQDFAQRVRRYPQDALLRGASRLGAHLERVALGQESARLPDVVTPFNLGGLARTAITAANNYRSAIVTDEVVVDLCAWYSEILDPDLLSPSSDLRPILSRIAYEQFANAYSVMENIGRMQRLLIDGGESVTSLPTEDDWRDVLGVGLQQFARIGFAMNTAALSNQGCIDRAVLGMAHVAPIFSPLSAEEALQIVDRWFAEPVGKLRAVGRDAEQRGVEKLSFNPIRYKPVVALEGQQYVMPWPRLIVDRFTMPGLYFIGLDAFGSAFTRALGPRFESYIGEQLAQLVSARVEPEVTYGRPERKTVDFFLVTDEVVVLVEVKACRPIEATRHGLVDGDDDTVKKIGAAFRQIDVTAELLRRGQPELAHIPLTGRALCGLVVTAEPFQLVNSGLYDDLLNRPSIPTTVVCSHDLERFVGTVEQIPHVGSILNEAIVQHAHRWQTLDEAVSNRPASSNSLLVGAYNRLLAFEGPTPE